jgi:hypothetical protein
VVNERRIDGFFYGLFMDIGVLRNSGVVPVNPRKAYVNGFALRVGSRATLVPSAGDRAYGMLIALTHPELERLYGAPGLDQYRAEAVVACCIDGAAVPALCYNLLVEPRAGERNPDYAARLQKVLRDLNFPAEYVDSILRG